MNRFLVKQEEALKHARFSWFVVDSTTGEAATKVEVQGIERPVYYVSRGVAQGVANALARK